MNNVTTTDLIGNYLDFWPSGYSTEYGFRAAVLDPGEFAIGGVEFDRISISMAHDGTDLWTDFALPDNADFFASMELARYIAFQPGFVTGTITSLTATAVPVPPLLPLTALALVLVGQRKRSLQPRSAHHAV